MFPGLCGDAPVAVHRVLMGTLPQLATERRLMRQLQPVMPWFQTRRRVKEMSSEFIELDLASIDAETMLRYSHVFYVRRQICTDSTEKQLSMLESGKAPKAADQGLTSCLADLNKRIGPRLEAELTRLAEAKKTAAYQLFPATGNTQQQEPNTESIATMKKPLELEPDSHLERSDLLTMMRVCEEQEAGIEDLESRCKPFLPAPYINAAARKFAMSIVGQDNVRLDIDKKELKLLYRMTVPDYNKPGSIEKFRPLDVTASFRFHGERLPKKGSTFTRCLWGHFFRKFSTHPSFLVSISKNWVVATGLSTDVTNPYLPIDLATAAWRQQSMFPALKFRTQYLYTSADYARHAWKEDHFIPMMRLFPLLGQNVAEDLAACILVDGFWAKLALQPSDTVHDESFWGSVAEFVDEMTALREHDGFAVKVSDFFHLAMPSLETTKKNQQEAPAATAP